MKKLSEEEYGALPLIGGGRIGPLYRAVAGLDVGEAMLIETADHQKKYHPRLTVNRVGKKLGRTYLTLTVATGEGWTVKRLS